MINLYRHQLIALNYLRFNDGYMLCMEQGTGKTLPTLTRILELILMGSIKNCLVVCPKSVIGSWERDMEKFTPKQQIAFKAVYVINYDKVWRDKFYNQKWDCIVLDEAHCIKNRTSKRAAFLLNLAIGAKYRYLLTGTPISNGQLENLWSLICFLEPYKSGRSVCSKIFAERDGGRGTYAEWCNKYAYLDQYHKPYKYHNVQQLQEIFQEFSFRVTKEQCLDLPAKLPDEIRDITLIGGKKTYKDIAKTSASLELDFIADNPLVRLTKLRQLASGFFIKENGSAIDYDSEKKQALIDLLDSISGKLVIFAEFKYSIKTICKVLTDKKIKFVVLDGDQKDKTIWREFQNDESITVIVCQYASACQGIDLYASSRILYYEPCIRSSQYEQSQDRIHRNGQKQKCSYIHFITKGTVEEAIYKALKGYSDFNEKLFTQYLQEYQRSKR